MIAIPPARRPRRPDAAEGAHEPIVSRDLWQRVQTILDRQAEEAAKHSRKNPFGRYARCGACGSRLAFHTQGDKRYRYLRCEQADCRAVSVPFDNFEAAVVFQLHGVHLALTDRIVDPRWSLTPDTPWPAAQRLSEIAEELAENDEKEERLIDAIAEGTIKRERVRDRLSNITSYRRSLELERDRLGREEQGHREELEAILAVLDGEAAWPQPEDSPPDVIPHFRAIFTWLSADTEARESIVAQLFDRLELHADEAAPILQSYFRAGFAVAGPVQPRRSGDARHFSDLGFGRTEPLASPVGPLLSSGVVVRAFQEPAGVSALQSSPLRSWPPVGHSPAPAAVRTRSRAA